MIWYLLGGDYETFLLIAVVLVIALSLHEFGHAWAANAQGDPTARLAGRLTLDPRAHIDPIGALAMVLVGFGWGKPVPFSIHLLRNKRFGPALVALAGPATNVFLAFLAAALLRLAVPGGGLSVRFLVLLLQLNVLLALFNLLPIPPLDGSRILSAALPPSKQSVIYFLDRWGMLILFVGVFFVFRGALSSAAAYLSSRLVALFGLS